MPRYIAQHSLENLKKYKYSGVDRSILSRHVLTPYWNWLVTLWPHYVAPNTITLTGLVLVIANFFTMLYYDPAYLCEKGGATGPPYWIYFTWAVGLFMYQSLDAIDGKQARRTGMAGPLGEMFDHGCDALNTTLEVVICCRALNVGRSWWTVASVIGTMANFYLTTWEEYYTGQLYLGVFSGPVEGIIVICAIYIITGFKGPEFWDTPIFTATPLGQIPEVAKYVPDVSLSEAFMWWGAGGLLFNILTGYLNVFRARVSTRQSVLSPLLSLLPFPTTCLIQVAWLASSATSAHFEGIVHSPLLLPFLCSWGLQFAHTVGRMILAHITKEPYPLWDWMWLWSIIGAFDAALPVAFGRDAIIQTTPARTAWLVYATLGISFITYARFVVLVIYDITEYLGIACLTVRKKDDNGRWISAAEVDRQKNK